MVEEEELGYYDIVKSKQKSCAYALFSFSYPLPLRLATPRYIVVPSISLIFFLSLYARVILLKPFKDKTVQTIGANSGVIPRDLACHLLLVRWMQ